MVYNFIIVFSFLYAYCAKNRALQDQFLEIVTFETKKWIDPEHSFYTKKLHLELLKGAYTI